jgi:hypothetical protein
MDSLLKVIGFILYIVFSPLLLITEGLVFVVQSINYSFARFQSAKAKHTKQMAAFLKQHRHHFRWNLHRPGWMK